MWVTGHLPPDRTRGTRNPTIRLTGRTGTRTQVGRGVSGRGTTDPPTAPPPHSFRGFFPSPTQSGIDVQAQGARDRRAARLRRRH